MQRVTRSNVDNTLVQVEDPEQIIPGKMQKHGRSRPKTPGIQETPTARSTARLRR